MTHPTTSTAVELASLPLWDRSALSEYAALASPERLGRVVRSFRTRASDARDALSGALGDRALWAEHSHALISSAGLLGFTRLAVESRRVQTILKDPDAVPGPDEWTLLATIEEAIAAADEAFPAPAASTVAA